MPLAATLTEWTNTILFGLGILAVFVFMLPKGKRFYDPAR